MPKTRLTPEDIKFVINVLRQGTTKWPGRAEALKKARRKVRTKFTKAGLPVFKYHWQCAKCMAWFRDEKMMEVDHIIEIGSFTGDWTELIDKMYDASVGRKNLQVLCKSDHLAKTKIFQSAMTQWKRKKPSALLREPD